MKGQRPEAEMNKLPAGVSVTAVHRLDVPGVDGERHLVVIRGQ
jgi:16S rRNA (guanine527-N7)-methyltransferase